MLRSDHDPNPCNDSKPEIRRLPNRHPSLCNHVGKSGISDQDRTDLGLAQSGYHHSPDNPVFGTGQGSAFSPAIWFFISCILYDIYEKLAKTASYCNPDRSHLLEIGMIGFVDDNNDQTNRFLQDEDPTTLPLVIDQTQFNAQCWNDLPTASGGALEIPKMFISCSPLEVRKKWKSCIGIGGQLTASSGCSRLLNQFPTTTSTAIAVHCSQDTRTFQGARRDAERTIPPVKNPN